MFNLLEGKEVDFLEPTKGTYRYKKPTRAGTVHPLLKHNFNTTKFKIIPHLRKNRYNDDPISAGAHVLETQPAAGHVPLQGAT